MNYQLKEKKYIYRITVRILGIETVIPLFILFRSLGYETDKEILSLIIYDSDNEFIKK